MKLKISKVGHARHKICYKSLSFISLQSSSCYLYGAPATKKNMGAKGLRSIVEMSMQSLMFKIPDKPDVKKVIITAGTIDGMEELVMFGASNRKIA